MGKVLVAKNVWKLIMEKGLISFEGLKEIVYQYYPRNLYDMEPGYELTDEFNRLVEACSNAQHNDGLWKKFLELLAKEFPENEIEDCTQLFHRDPCYRCKINLAGTSNLYRSLVVHVSIIAPFGSVYISEITVENAKYSTPQISFLPITSEDQECFARIGFNLKEIFGYDLLPVELLTKVVPDVAVKNQLLNESTIFHCLFTDHII